MIATCTDCKRVLRRADGSEMTAPEPPARAYCAACLLKRIGLATRSRQR